MGRKVENFKACSLSVLPNGRNWNITTSLGVWNNTQCRGLWSYWSLHFIFLWDLFSYCELFLLVSFFFCLFVFLNLGLSRPPPYFILFYLVHSSFLSLSSPRNIFQLLMNHIGSNTDTWNISVAVSYLIQSRCLWESLLISKKRGQFEDVFVKKNRK